MVILNKLSTNLFTVAGKVSVERTASSGTAFITGGLAAPVMGFTGTGTGVALEFDADCVTAFKPMSPIPNC